MTSPDRQRRTLAPLLPELRELRTSLHRHPCLSEQEGPTAERIAERLQRLGPSELLTELGGTGVAAVFDGGEPGPTVLLRAELDALPIAEPEDAPAHRSVVDGVSHKCGHDGHMTILTGVGELLSRTPPARGRVVLLYQPAEETGTGARAVLADPRFAALAPDWSFALHNLPGFPAGSVVVRPGPFAAASEGLRVRAIGTTSHASEPHTGRNPALALSQMVQSMLALPRQLLPMDGVATVAISHIRLGESAFGISPGEGVVQGTFRSTSAADLARLLEAAERAARGIAGAHGLEVELSRHEAFNETVNDAAATRIVERTARQTGLEVREVERPFPWSEDFGEFLARGRGALFGLGAGADHPDLHHLAYDFPDDVIEAGVLALHGAAAEAASADETDEPGA